VRYTVRMTDLIALIDREIATLKEARAQIVATAPTSAKKKPGRPANAPVAKPKHKMSPEGRARLVAALKARWAAKRK
jgi:hypothetical protein